MDREIFAADISPGSPATITEVKTLVCIVLTQAGEMSFSLLHESLRENRLVNYFELIRALTQLVKTEHVSCKITCGEELYSITALGERTAAELAADIPAAVREKAVLAAELVKKREKRMAEVEIKIENRDGGYYLTLALPGDNEKLVEFTVFAPTEQECEKLRHRFLNAPVFIYQGVMALLSGRRDVLGEPLPQENLF